MKKRFLLSVVLLCSLVSFADDSAWKTLLLLPDANGFLPAAASTIVDKQHVVVQASLQNYDEDIYVTSKKLRETDRGVQAELEEPYQALPSRFSEIMGADLADVATFPKMHALFKACVDLKDYNTDYYMKDGVPTKGLRSVAILRSRPRDRFVHAEETYTSIETSSYPSGHGYAEWLVASCLAYINPSKSTQLYAVAQDYGFSRVIIAAHWMTDINAGERLAAAAFPTLVSNPDFLQLLNEARTEYQTFVTNYPAYQTPQVTISEDFDWETKYKSYGETTTNILCRYNGQHIDVTLGRTLLANQWNALCLPFSLETLAGTPLEGAKVMAYKNAYQQVNKAQQQELVLEFEEVTSMQAGVSYLVNIGKQNLVNPTFRHVLLIMKDPHVKRVNLDFTRNVKHNDITFCGVIGKKSVSGTNILLLGDNDILYYPAAAESVKGFRAYFELPADADQLPARIVCKQVDTPTNLITTPTQTQESSVTYKKYLQDGVVTIENNGISYLTTGQTIQ